MASHTSHQFLATTAQLSLLHLHKHLLLFKHNGIHCSISVGHSGMHVYMHLVIFMTFCTSYSTEHFVLPQHAERQQRLLRGMLLTVLCCKARQC